jgi:hypothetical protein
MTNRDFKPITRARHVRAIELPFAPFAKARLLDRLADAELQQGHTDIAESLARRAADLREAAR